MKKTRLLSMLLAAVMTATAVPMLALPTAAAASSGNANLLEGATADVAVTTIKATDPDTNSEADNNEYLSADIYKSANEVYLTFHFDLTAEQAAQKLYFEFSQRLSPGEVTGGDTGFPGYRICVNSWLGAGTVNAGDGLNWPKYNGDWVTNEVEITNYKEGENYIHFFKSSHTTVMLPTDFDNIGIYYLNNGKKEYIGKRIVGDYASLIGSVIVAGSAVLSAEAYDEFDRIAAPADGNTSVTYTLAESPVPGYYKLSGKYRLGNIDFNTTGAVNTGNLTVTLADTTVTKPISYTWNELDETIKITAEDVTSVTFAADLQRALELDDLKLELVSELATTIDKDDTLLKGSTLTATGLVESVSPANPDGTSYRGNNYLTIYNRPWPHDDCLVITTNETILPTRQYYLSFDVRTSVPDLDPATGNPYGMVLRIYGNNALYNTANTQLPASPTSDAQRCFILTENNDATYFVSAGQYMFDVNENWVHVEGLLAPRASIGNKLQITLRRGMNSNYNQPTDIDNIRLWYVDSEGKSGIIYSSTFEKDTSMASLSSGVGSTMEIATELPYSEVYAEDGVNTSFSYDFGDGLPEGKYLFAVELRNGIHYIGQNADNSHNAKIVYTFSDGSTKEGQLNELAHVWNKISYLVSVPEGETLVKVEVIADASIPLQYRNASLVSADKASDGMPDVGIIMVLLKKMQGNVRTVKEKVEYVINGDFEDASAFDFAKVTNTYANLAKDTWMNHSNYAGKMEIINVDGNNVLSVSDITTNWNGIAYGLGVLEPGEYVFSGKLKLANTADSCGMRVSVNTNNNLDTYIVPDNNAIHTVDGKKWLEFSYKFTVTEPTAATVRIRGGMAGAPDTKPYYVDDLSVSTTVTRQIVLEPEVDAEAAE